MNVLTNLPWWQSIAGIVAIPAALVGIVYTIVLIRKTLLETRKLESDLLVERTPGRIVITGKFVKEMIIRQELQALRDLGIRVFLWGTTSLVALEIAIYFMRQNAQRSMVASGLLDIGQPLPLARHLVGTCLLLVVATIFGAFLSSIMQSHRHYKFLLLASARPSNEWQSSAMQRAIVIAIFLVFPLFDLMMRMYVAIQITVH